MRPVIAEPKRYAADYLFVLGDARGALARTLVLSLAAAGLELLGVGLIAPLVAVVASGSVPPWLQSLVAAPGSAFALIGIGLVVVFAAKAWLGYRLNLRITRFSEAHKAGLVDRLMGAYQAMDWQTLAARSSNELVSRALWWTEAYSSGTLGASMRLVTDALIFVALGALLALADPASVAIVGVVLGAVFLGVHYGVRRRRAALEARLLQAYERTANNVAQALGGLREIRVLGHEAWFRAEVREASGRQAEAAAQQAALGMVPRYAVEAALLTVLVAVAGLRFALEGSAAEAIPLLAMFAAASVRLMPASTSLMANLNTLRATRFVLGEIADELRELGAGAAAGPAQLEPAPGQMLVQPFRELRLERVSFAYRGASRPVFTDFSLSIRVGEAVGITGPSGAGKSTLADLILGFLEPSAGRVLVNGEDVRRDLRGWLDRAAYIPQAPYLLDDTLLRNIVFGTPAERIDRARVERAIDDAQLREVVDALPAGIHAEVGERGVRLSGGQRQRLAIARALYQGREFLVLDEATSALDAETERDVLRAVRVLHGRTTLLVIAHSERTLAVCDRIERLPAEPKAKVVVGLREARRA
ncbi:MAG: ABC transporter ATP-binding protein [Burkholderiales bacterium]|nr:ABC transporter ATP-binding protein [Burkholderiales bacterium]